jgi:hypothetical protein
VGEENWRRIMILETHRCTMTKSHINRRQGSKYQLNFKNSNILVMSEKKILILKSQNLVCTSLSFNRGDTLQSPYYPRFQSLCVSECPCGPSKPPTISDVLAGDEGRWASPLLF